MRGEDGDRRGLGAGELDRNASSFFCFNFFGVEVLCVRRGISIDGTDGASELGVYRDRSEGSLCSSYLTGASRVGAHWWQCDHVTYATSSPPTSVCRTLPPLSATTLPQALCIHPPILWTRFTPSAPPPPHDAVVWSSASDSTIVSPSVIHRTSAGSLYSTPAAWQELPPFVWTQLPQVSS